MNCRRMVRRSGRRRKAHASMPPTSGQLAIAESGRVRSARPGTMGALAETTIILPERESRCPGPRTGNRFCQQVAELGDTPRHVEVEVHGPQRLAALLDDDLPSVPMPSARATTTAMSSGVPVFLCRHFRIAFHLLLQRFPTRTSCLRIQHAKCPTLEHL